jgi:heterodisulfide reductase subunit A
LQEQTFDLLVLALGFAPPQGMRDLAQGLGLDLNDYGFAVSEAYAPTQTNRPGVFVAGAFREPKDIPETVTEAAAAAGQVAAFLNRGGAEPPAAISTPTSQTLRDVTEEEPKLGVFCCQCNGDLEPLDSDALAAWAGGLPGVALAQTVPMACTPEGQASIQAAIQRAQLNRVVVAGCSHRLFAGEFDELMAGAGLDPRLLARVNLREQVVYPHAALSPVDKIGDNGASGSTGNGRRGQVLNSKAQSLVAMAAASLKAMAGIDALNLGGNQSLTRQALVLGGGAAGMAAALRLADLGIPTHLVERQDQLGGQWRHIRYQADGSDPAAALEALIGQVEEQPAITLHLGSELLHFEGGPGHYRSTISSGDEPQALDHGVLIVATGGQPASSDEYLYDDDPRVLTQRQLEQQIADGTLATAQALVMIQCAGSREPQRPYCSRVCCTQAVKNALKLKELRPDLDIYILYREVRTYGFREAYYQAARDAGVIFVRYELPELPGGTQKPIVQAGGDRLQVTVSDPITGQSLDLAADLLVLSTGIEPHDQAVLAQRLDLDLDEGGFFQEQHPKMKPLDLNRGGVFVAGLAHSPRFLDETLAQAQGAAMRAAAFLAPGEVSEQPTSVWVNARLCSFCGLCVEACPFGARLMNDDSRVADVDYALCQGCGVCAMVCPNKATLQKAFEHKQLMSAIDMALV